MNRNVVLVCLDAVRKDFFEYAAWRLAELSGTSFEQCRAASTWTVPSHASILMSELPHNHGIHAYNRDFSGINERETFFADLDGYERVGISANPYVGTEFGFDKFFDEFSKVNGTDLFSDTLDAYEIVSNAGGNKGFSTLYHLLISLIQHDHPMKSAANAIAAQANVVSRSLPIPTLFDDGANIATTRFEAYAETANEPFFAYLNLMEAHGPLTPTRGFETSVPSHWHSNIFDGWDVNLNGQQAKHKQHVQNYRALYAAAIDYLDRKLAEMVQTVQKQTGCETTFIITADHGENLGYPDDGGVFFHTTSLSEAILHVPLYIINAPESYPTSEQRLFSQLDLGPLIVDLAAGQRYTPTTASSAAESIGISGGEDRMTNDERNYWDRTLRCCYREQTKVVWDSLGNATEYTIDSDLPCRQTERSDNIDVPEWATRPFAVDIETCADKHNGKTQQNSEVSAHTRERLAELGYL